VVEGWYGASAAVVWLVGGWGLLLRIPLGLVSGGGGVRGLWYSLFGTLVGLVGPVAFGEPSPFSPDGRRPGLLGAFSPGVVRPVVSGRSVRGCVRRLFTSRRGLDDP